eukprot:349918-Chlamydomonas_euryale.AAC.1
MPATLLVVYMPHTHACSAALRREQCVTPRSHFLCNCPHFDLTQNLQAQLKLLPVLSRPGQAGADLAPQQLPLPSQPQQQQQQQQAQQPQQRQPPQQQHLPPLSGTQPCLPPLLVYLSSTGVYGDAGGDWVDESSEPRPSAARGAVRLEAEAAWRRSARDAGLPLAILRLGGAHATGACPGLPPVAPSVYAWPGVQMFRRV